MADTPSTRFKRLNEAWQYGIAISKCLGDSSNGIWIGNGELQRQAG
jgi:hypothetical protein